jgi:plasmid stabilization system protein ParE
MVIWSKPAKKDLKQIFEYIARDSRFYAKKAVNNIVEKSMSLDSSPRRGRIVPEIIFPYRGTVFPGPAMIFPGDKRFFRLREWCFPVNNVFSQQGMVPCKLFLMDGFQESEPYLGKSKGNRQMANKWCIPDPISQINLLTP